MKMIANRETIFLLELCGLSSASTSPIAKVKGHFRNVLLSLFMLLTLGPTIRYFVTHMNDTDFRKATDSLIMISAFGLTMATYWALCYQKQRLNVFLEELQSTIGDRKLCKVRMKNKFGSEWILIGLRLPGPREMHVQKEDERRLSTSKITAMLFKGFLPAAYSFVFGFILISHYGIQGVPPENLILPYKVK